MTVLRVRRAEGLLSVPDREIRTLKKAWSYELSSWRTTMSRLISKE